MYVPTSPMYCLLQWFITGGSAYKFPGGRESSRALHGKFLNEKVLRQI